MKALSLGLAIVAMSVSSLVSAEKGKGLEWRNVHSDGGSYDSIAHVPGGVLVRSEFMGRASLAFVPLPSDVSWNPPVVNDISGNFRGKFVKLPTKGGLAHVALDKVVALKEVTGGQTEVLLEGGQSVTVTKQAQVIIQMLRPYAY